MKYRNLKIISTLLSGLVAFCVLYLMGGYFFQITHTLYGVFANIFGGVLLFAMPASLIVAVLWFRAQQWRIASASFWVLLLNFGLLSLLFFPPV
ncbi:MAG: hypothetical protein AAF587_41360 [Bacteroidota bacterium]